MNVKYTMPELQSLTVSPGLLGELLYKRRRRHMVVTGLGFTSSSERRAVAGRGFFHSRNNLFRLGLSLNNLSITIAGITQSLRRIVIPVLRPVTAL